MKKIRSVRDINTLTESGRLLLIAVGQLMSFYRKDTPEEILERLNKISEETWKGEIICQL